MIESKKDLSDIHLRETAMYFADLEDKIVERLRVEASTEEGRAELLRSTGITDQHLLDELRRLGITADGMVSLRLFPLVLVAWAEGNVDVGERETVMTEARRVGIHNESTAWVILDLWLKKRPPGLGVDAWKRYLHGNFEKISSVARNRLIDLTEKQMTAVAKSSGGHLGFGKISSKEHAIIHQIGFAMRQQTLAK